MNGYRVEVLDEFIRLQEATNDHQVRAVIDFDARIDLERLAAAVRRSIDLVPILGCSYSTERRAARWEPQSWGTGDLFRVRSEAGEELVGYLKARAPNSGPQLLVQALRRPARDTVLVTVNHMAFDGTGFKEYLYLLARIYSGVAVADPAAHAGGGERSLDALLRNIPLSKRISSLFRRTFVGDGAGGLAPGGENPTLRLALLRIEGETYSAVQAYCKGIGVTLNDLVLSLFGRSLFAAHPGERLEAVTLQTMIDLRRYASTHPVSPFGNFSSMESLTLRNGVQPLSDLTAEVGRQMRRVKARLPGVKNVVLMNLAHKLLPRRRFDALLSDRIRSISASTTNVGVIDGERLRFQGAAVADAFLLASIKDEPAFQLTFSTYEGRMTLAFLGSYSDPNWETIQRIAAGMERELSAIRTGRRVD